MLEQNGSAEFYSCDPSAERLVATAIHEAVEDAVDQWVEAPRHDDEIEVIGYRRAELPSRERIADFITDQVLEWLDEEYADPERINDSSHEEIKEAAREFASVVREHYEVWACEKVGSFTVKVRDYVPEEWIAPAPDADERE